MKIVCSVCEQVFSPAQVTFDKDSNVIKSSEKPFELVPSHPAVPGKKETQVRDSRTGEILEIICDGSLRPVKVKVN